ncbi:MAG: cell division protein FtsA [Holosporaceae bacterium]|jgi:cell division protein FtsA|nr:cell division protein FtsA [Holosporaceae bacterium]
MMAGSTVTVLDIGSTKVCCCIANCLIDGRFEIIGVGYCACNGVKSGVIIDIKAVERAVAKAVENAEKMVNFRVKSVYVNISGKNVESKIIKVSIKIGGRVVTNEDLLDLMNYCNQESEDRAVIHSIPILYDIDSLRGIKNPIGMVANTLNVNVNLVTAPKAQLNNLLICLARCHLDPVGIVASIYASGLCVIDADDALSNKIVIDLGGGTTSIGFFYQGIFSGMEVIPLGSKNITDDVAYGLNISTANAERLKTLHGAAFISIRDESDTIFAPVIEDDDVINLQRISKVSLNQIIQPRVEEILLIIKERIEKSVFTDSFSKSIIVTGGGSLLTGIRDFSVGILNKKVKVKRMGNFINVPDVDISNNFSVAVGMIKFAQISDDYLMRNKKSAKKNEKDGFIKKTLAWIENNL